MSDHPQAMLQAMLTSSAIRNDTSMSTDVRTYLRRTTHLGEIPHVGNRAQGGTTEFAAKLGIATLGAELNPIQDALDALYAKPSRHPVRRTSRTEQRETIDRADRKYVYERDNFRCQWCGTDQRLTLDHIIPWSAGGSDHADNLRTLCWTCNEHRSNFRNIDDGWRPLPLTYCCVDCDAELQAEYPGSKPHPVDHPSRTQCFCWWHRHAAIGSRSLWFAENNAAWDWDLNWHREKTDA